MMLDSLPIAVAFGIFGFFVFETRSQLNQIIQALRILRLQSEEVPPPSTSEATSQDVQDMWLAPFAFFLEEMVLQRAYVECLASYILDRPTDASSRQNDVDEIEVEKELGVAKQNLASMIQANQQVRNGKLTVLEARRRLEGDSVLLFPLGSPGSRISNRFADEVHDKMLLDERGITERFRTQGAFPTDRGQPISSDSDLPA